MTLATLLSLLRKPVIFATTPKQVSIIVCFYVVHFDNNYNVILGRTTLISLMRIKSIPHLKIKFPTEFGVGEVVGDQSMSRKCYVQTLQSAIIGVNKQKETATIEMKPFIEVGLEPLATPVKEIEEVEIV